MNSLSRATARLRSRNLRGPPRTPPALASWSTTAAAACPAPSRLLGQQGRRRGARTPTRISPPRTRTRTARAPLRRRKRTGRDRSRVGWRRRRRGTEAGGGGGDAREWVRFVLCLRRRFGPRAHARYALPARLVRRLRLTSFIADFEDAASPQLPVARRTAHPATACALRACLAD
jgi:hypothetical protein